MARNGTSYDRHAAESIATRLGERAIPKALEPFARAFTAKQKAHELAANATSAAEDERDSALMDVGDADEALDAAVDRLVDLLPGAGLGTRQQPLKEYGSHNPTQLEALPYAVEPDEVARVVAKVALKKPPASITAAGKACLAAGAKVKARLEVYGSKQTAYLEALRARDALLPDLVKSQRSLKTQGAAAWEGDPGTLAAVFAPPARLVAPKKKRAAKPKTPPKDGG